MFLYKLDLSEEYYQLYGAPHEGIVKSYVVSASHPRDAQVLANNHLGGRERNVSLGGFGLLGYGDRTNIWLHNKYITISKIGTSEVPMGVIIFSSQ